MTQKEKKDEEDQETKQFVLLLFKTFREKKKILGKIRIFEMFLYQGEVWSSTELKDSILQHGFSTSGCCSSLSTEAKQSVIRKQDKVLCFFVTSLSNSIRSAKLLRCVSPLTVLPPRLCTTYKTHRLIKYLKVSLNTLSKG